MLIGAMIGYSRGVHEQGSWVDLARYKGTPVTLTVEEPRKFCVLFHCTHTVDFTTRYQHEKLSCQWKA